MQENLGRPALTTRRLRDVEVSHTSSVWVGTEGCIFDDAYQRGRKIYCENED